MTQARAASIGAWAGMIETMLTDNWKIPISFVIEPASSDPAVAGVLPSPVDSSFEPWLDSDTREEFGCCYEDGDGYHICLYGSGSFAFDRRLSGPVRGIPEPGVTPEAFQHDFYRKALPFILQWHSWEVLHANGLVVSGACVALCGDSRMGKSTLAHAWSSRGGVVFADDTLPFRFEGSSISVSPIPFRIRARPPARDYFGALNEATSPDADRTHGAATVVGSPLQAIYLLERCPEEDGPVQIALVPPQDALPEILRHALCLHLRDRTRNAAMMAHYLALADGVPAYRLSYPTGLGHVGAILDRLITHAAERHAGSRP